MFGLEFFLPALIGIGVGAGASMLMNQQAPDYSAQMQQSNAAHQAALDALAAQTASLEKAKDAMVPVADSEAARRAAERRARQLRSRPSTLFGGDDELGAPNVGFRMLFGSA
jgi:hypothetical protein